MRRSRSKTRFDLEDVKVIEYAKSPHSSFRELYYDEDELAEMRHDAFLEAAGLVEIEVDDDGNDIGPVKNDVFEEEEQETNSMDG